jgi:hypothetical protein
MKNTIFLFIAALLFGASVNAQSTVDSINAKYQLLPMPQAMTLEKSFPVIGSYNLTTKEGTTVPVTISIDSASKGIVWVDGLPEGKFKAYLKRSPATYRVVAQKTEAGKAIPEGTMIFDQATNTLNVALGKKFDDVDPAAIFTMNGDVTADVASGTEVKVKSKTATKKTKEKVVFYSATKADTTTTTSTNVNQQQ